MSNKEKHWEKTKGLMILTLIIWFIFGYLIFMFGSSLNTSNFLGYPLAYYMCAQGSIIAFVVLIFWFVLQLINGASAGSGGGVAFGAHIGGFIAGVIVAPILAVVTRKKAE